ncbi:MAG TPA: hypothetical protein VF755_25695 [Catenuloplanes sp.]|jgi:hypothetical protein
MAPDLAGWRAAAALSAAASAASHVAVAVAHAGHDTRYVLFFVAVGSAQLMLAVLLRQRPHPALVLAAMLGTVALIVAYSAQQLGALPSVGGHHLDAAQVAALGVATLVTELVTLTALPLLVAGRWRSSSLNVALLGGVALWTMFLVG